MYLYKLLFLVKEYKYYYIFNHIFYVDLFYQNFGAIHVGDCLNDCSMAWLYKDAEMFGMEEYRKLLGEDNVVCSDSGPILAGDNPNLIKHFDSCPSMI